MLKDKMLKLILTLWTLILASCGDNSSGSIAVTSKSADSSATVSSTATSVSQTNNSSDVASSASVSSSASDTGSSQSSSSDDGYYYAEDIQSVINKGAAENVDVKGVVVSIGNSYILVSDGCKAISVYFVSQGLAETQKALRIRQAVQTSSDFSEGDYVEVRGSVISSGLGLKTSLSFAEGATVTKLETGTAPSIPSPTDISSISDFNNVIKDLEAKTSANKWVADHPYKIPLSFLKHDKEYNNLSFEVLGADGLLNNGTFEHYPSSDFSEASFYSLNVYFLSVTSWWFSCAVSTYERVTDIAYTDMNVAEVQEAKMGTLVHTKGIVTGMDTYGNALIDDGNGKIETEFGKEAVGGIAEGDYLDLKGFVGYGDADTAIKRFVPTAVGLAGADSSTYPTISSEATPIATKEAFMTLINQYREGSPYVKPSSYLEIANAKIGMVDSSSAYATVTYDNTDYSLRIVNPSGKGLIKGTTVALKGYIYESSSGTLLIYMCTRTFADARPTLVDIFTFQQLEDGAKVMIDAYIAGSGPLNFLIADSTGWQYCEVAMSLYGDVSLQNARRNVFTGTKRTSGGIEQFYISAIKALGTSIDYKAPNLESAKSVTDKTSFAALTYGAKEMRNSGAKGAVLVNYYTYPIVKITGVLGYLNTYFSYKDAASSGPFGNISPDYALFAAQQSPFMSEYATYDIYGFFIGLENVQDTYTNYRFIFIKGEKVSDNELVFDNIKAGGNIPNPNPDSEPTPDPSADLKWTLYATPIELDYHEKQLIRIHSWPIQIPVPAWNAYGLTYFFYESETATKQNIGTMLNFTSSSSLTNLSWILENTNSGSEDYSCYVEFSFRVLGCVSNRVTITYKGGNVN